MKKINILFVCVGINTGGIERALINILDIIDYTKYNVDLLLWDVHGDLKKYINENVHIIDGINYRVKKKSEFKNNFNFNEFVKYICFLLLCRIGKPWKIFKKMGTRL